MNCYYDEIQKNRELGLVLTAATERKDFEMATYLVSKGASIDFESDQGLSPLKLASMRGEVDLVNYMLRKGTNDDKTMQTRRRSINRAISSASQSGHIELIELLLKNNANLWDEESMQTSALHSAVNGGQLHLIR